MQVHCDNVVTSRDYKHICDKLGCNRRARRVLLVYARIRVARDDGGDTASRGSLACGYEDQQLHQAVVHISAAALKDEDVLFANRLADLDARLAIRKLLDNTRGQGDVESRIV